jgi:hypothetical protein
MSAFERHNTMLESAIVCAVTWGLDKFDPTVIGHAFFSKPVSLALYTFRRYRCGAENMGDVFFEEYDKVCYILIALGLNGSSDNRME